MKLLVVDDNKGIRLSLKLILESDGHSVIPTGDPRLIPAMLAKGDVDAVILDMNFDNVSLDGAEGLFWLSHIKEIPEPPAVILITAFGEISLAVEAMKYGADDFITKPWNNDELIRKINGAIAKNQRKRTEHRNITDAGRIMLRETERQNMTLDEIKVSHVKATLERCGGNLSLAAERLGINRQTLYNILKKNQ